MGTLPSGGALAGLFWGEERKAGPQGRMLQTVDCLKMGHGEASQACCPSARLGCTLLFPPHLRHSGPAERGSSTPMALLSPGLSLREMPVGAGTVLVSAPQGKVCPWRGGKVCLLTPSASWSSRPGQPEGSNFQKHIFFFLKQCRLSRGELSGRGKRKKGHHHSSECLQGFKTQVCRFPCPGKHLRQFLNTPQFVPTWAGYECCQRYKTIMTAL